MSEDIKTVAELFEAVEQYQELSQAVREFFELLDIVEISENDVEFHPVTINTCRASTIVPLDDVLTKMKELSRDRS